MLCVKCNTDKPLAEFRRGIERYKNPTCRKCAAARGRERREHQKVELLRLRTLDKIIPSIIEMMEKGKPQKP